VSVSLTILIPTFNRHDQLSFLLSELQHSPSLLGYSHLEILISDNHSNPPLKKPKESDSGIPIRVIAPPAHLVTAEENLAFALKHVTSEFVWVLGDDDLPIESTIEILLKLVKEDSFDLAIFNSTVLSKDLRVNGRLRLRLSNHLVEIPFDEFLKRAGFWSITAGFSTLVFRVSKFDLDFFLSLHSKKLYIYSHVTALAKSFCPGKFLVVDSPLVKYRENSFDNDSSVSDEKSRHWVNYSEKRNAFYAHIWTLSFLEQINILEELGIFELKDLNVTMEQSHNGYRFFISEHILINFLEQLIYERKNLKAKKMQEREIDRFVYLLHKVDSELGVLAKLALIQVGSNQEFRVRRMTTDLAVSRNQLERRKFLLHEDTTAFKTPYGLVWAPIELNSQLHLKNLITVERAFSSEDADELLGLIKEYPANATGDWESEYLPKYWWIIRAGMPFRRLVPRILRRKILSSIDTRFE
jgi:hypothetical protein